MSEIIEISDMYSDGINQIHAEKIEYLLENESFRNDIIDLTINEPLRKFYSELDYVNDIVAVYGDETLKVTKTLRYKAGYRKIIDKWINKRLELDKKSPNLYH